MEITTSKGVTTMVCQSCGKVKEFKGESRPSSDGMIGDHSSEEQSPIVPSIPTDRRITDVLLSLLSLR
jgi:hypothetical protein